MKWQELINRFNNGDDSFVESLFGDLETFFDIAINRKKLGHLFEPLSEESSPWQNKYLIFLYRNYRNMFVELVSDVFSDVIFRDGKFFYKVYDMKELSEYFCSRGRNENSKFIAEKILGDDDFFEYFNVYNDSILEDAIEEIDDENLKLLGKIILEQLKDVKIIPETELLEEIGYEQGHVDHAFVTQDNIKQILRDRKTLSFLLTLDELDEICSNIKSLYSNSYNNAYHDEVYEEVWSELSRFFVGKGEWIKVPNSKNSYFLLIELRDFLDDVLEYLLDNANYPDMALLNNTGMDFYDILKEKDCLSIHVPEYPDHRKVREYMNQNFDEVL